MSSDPRSVELVRVETREQTYDREKIFGRDASSVFPSLGGGGGEGEEKKDDARSKFVTESELQEMRDRGESTGGGGETNPDAGKPLYQILAEQKERKQQDFDEQWASMKVGKNRPLDAEEVEFLDELENERKAAEKKRQREESEELEAFKRAQVGKASNPSVSADVSTVQGTKEAPAAAPPVAVVARKKTIGVRVKAKAPTTKEAPEENPASGGLGGLLGDYGSDSD